MTTSHHQTSYSTSSNSENKKSSRGGEHFDVPITRGGGFFKDSAFDDCRSHYHDAIRNALSGWNKKTSSVFDDDNDDGGFGDEEINSMFRQRHQDRDRRREDRRKRVGDFFQGWDDGFSDFGKGRVFKESNNSHFDDKVGNSNFTSENGANCWTNQQNSQSCESHNNADKDGGITQMNKKCFNSCQQSFQSSGSNPSDDQSRINQSFQKTENQEESSNSPCNFDQKSYTEKIDNSSKTNPSSEGFKDASHKLIEENLDSFYNKRQNEEDLGREKKNTYDDSWNNFNSAATETFKNIGKETGKLSDQKRDDKWNTFTETDNTSGRSWDNFDDYEVPQKNIKSTKVRWGENEETDDDFIDDFSKYRNIRQKDVGNNDNFATNIKEEDLGHKIVLDLHEYKDGEVNVKVISATEILVECSADKFEGTKRVKLNFSKPFKFEDPIDAPGVTSVMSSEGVLTINVPKQVSGLDVLRSCLKNKNFP